MLLKSIFNAVGHFSPGRMSGSGSSGRGGSRGHGTRGSPLSSSLTSSARTIATELDHLRQSEVAYKARIRSVSVFGRLTSVSLP